MSACTNPARTLLKVVRRLLQATCDLYTSQCNRDDAGCVVNYYGSQCAAPKFAGGGEGLGLIAAINVEHAATPAYRSTVLAGPTASEQPLEVRWVDPASGAVNDAAAAAAVEFDSAAALGYTVRGFSSVVLAGRWVFSL